ncbi:hypothetical protein HDU96_008468, partial [Phlyctochytrium bullatum]
MEVIPFSSIRGPNEFLGEPQTNHLSHPLTTAATTAPTTLATPPSTWTGFLHRLLQDVVHLLVLLCQHDPHGPLSLPLPPLCPPIRHASKVVAPHPTTPTHFTRHHSSGPWLTLPLTNVDPLEFISFFGSITTKMSDVAINFPALLIAGVQ